MELAFTDPDLTLEGVAQTNQMRHLIDMQLAELFDDADILLVPDVAGARVRRRGPDPDRRRGQATSAPPRRRSSPRRSTSRATRSCPCPLGFVDGVPVGMQIVARRHEDGLAMQVAARYEQARPWPLLATGY